MPIRLEDAGKSFDGDNVIPPQNIEVSRGETMMSKATITWDRTMSNLKIIWGTWKAWLMGSGLGFFVGILPAAGATPGSLMAYGVAKMTAKDPSRFGKGAVEGVVARFFHG